MALMHRAADVLLQGGVIACPTEGVYGLSCLPNDIAAIARILDIKNRDSEKGLILIASSEEQLAGWIKLPEHRRLPVVDVENPVTWLVPPGPLVPSIVRGLHPNVAVRLTNNPIAQSICDAVDSPLVSTSANSSGRTTARNRFVLRRQFSGLVDYIVPGDCGPASGPSEIRNLLTGNVVRPTRHE